MALGAASLLLFFTPFLMVNGAAGERNRLPVMKSMQDRSDAVIKLLKRQLNCPVGEYHTNVHCCKLCPAGTFKSSDCSQEHGDPVCTRCQEGMYMDVPNNDVECHRCPLCDHGEGFEINQNCTTEQKTICQCMEHYFCEAPSPCKHCEPCDKCENGYVKEECTRRKNTVCQDNHRLPVYGIILIVGLLIAAAVAGIVGYFWWRKKKTPTPNQPTLEAIKFLDKDERHPDEIRYHRLCNADVDLEPYFTDIASQLTLDEILVVVRKNGMSEPMVEEIRQDNIQNAGEQKIQLLRRWYQIHGVRGAFSTLIKTLEQKEYCVSAKKIFENICSNAGSRMATNSNDPDEEHNI